MRALVTGARRRWGRLSSRVFHNPMGQRVLRWSRGGRAPLEWLLRMRAGRAFGPDGTLDVDADLGYRRLGREEAPAIEALLARCDQRIRDVRPHLPRWTKAQPGRFQIAFDLLGDEHLDRWPEFLDLALDEKLLGAATRYLGSLPVLRRIALGYSPPSRDPPRGSQLFHFDGEDARQLKLFVALEDIDAGSGPLTFHDAARSQRARIRLPRSRPDPPESRLHGPYSDEEVERIVQMPPQRFEGPRGSALWLDTSRCLHFGSRVEPGRERLMLMVAYRRFPAIHETPFNVFDEGRFAGDPLRRASLRPPRARPRGWYFPRPEDAVGPGARGEGR